MDIKICGITCCHQARAIVAAGANYLGFICVESSPRWVKPSLIQTIRQDLPQKLEPVKAVGVFANASLAEIEAVQSLAGFQVLQLHGQESPAFCQQVKERFPDTEIWKALRIRTAIDLAPAQAYETIVNRLLLDAYHPQLLGGTGETIDWSILQTFRPTIPWILAGGLTPENVGEALSHLHPSGVDVSSGVERSPGDKDLHQVQAFIRAASPNQSSGVVLREGEKARENPKFWYAFPPLLQGTLLRRYKRFMADIELDNGELITAHCPNTGPMTGVCIPGHRVAVSVSDNPKRKYAYTWELIEVLDNEPTWVGVNTSLPNRVVKQALEHRAFPQLGAYQTIESEVVYGQEGSRVDFRLTPETDSDRLIYVEVKNTTWAQGHLALFPDTVTTRGQKHLRELTGILPQHRSVLLYFINRGDCTHFAPGDQADPTYGKLLRKAIVAGLEILPYRFNITLAGIEWLGVAELSLSS